MRVFYKSKRTKKIYDLAGSEKKTEQITNSERSFSKLLFSSRSLNETSKIKQLKGKFKLTLEIKKLYHPYLYLARR